MRQNLVFIEAGDGDLLFENVLLFWAECQCLTPCRAIDRRANGARLRSASLPLTLRRPIFTPLLDVLEGLVYVTPELTGRRI